jgi:hypothetical protein
MAENGLCRRLPGASPALCALLDASRGSILAPIRAEIFGVQRFCQHARSLGQTHRAQSMPLWAATFFPHLKSNMVVLREAHKYIGLQASTGYDISPAAEWLLDNFPHHGAGATQGDPRRVCPPAIFQRFADAAWTQPLAGLPRMYGVAWAFVAHTDGAFDEELLVQLSGWPTRRNPRTQSQRDVGPADHTACGAWSRTCAAWPSGSPPARPPARSPTCVLTSIDTYDIDALDDHVLALLDTARRGSGFPDPGGPASARPPGNPGQCGDDISQLSVQGLAAQVPART